MSKYADTSKLKKWQYYAIHANKRRIREKYKKKLNENPVKIYQVIPFKIKEKPISIDIPGMVRIDKFKIKMPDGTIRTHPVFIRNGKEIDCLYVGPAISPSDAIFLEKNNPGLHIKLEGS